MRFIAIASLLLILSACATSSGNYTQTSDADNAVMARDAAHQLAMLYPPARTQLQIAQPTTDAFGKDLIQKLRREGYAIQEGAPDLGDQILSALAPVPQATPLQHQHRELPAPPNVKAGQQEVTAPAPDVETAGPDVISQLPPNAKKSGEAVIHESSKSSRKLDRSPAISLSYLVDQISGGMVRITLNVDSQTLSRVYLMQGHHLELAGSWTRKE